MFSPEDIIACICEGNTEKNIEIKIIYFFTI